DEESPLLRNARPGRHLHDRANTSLPGARLHLTETVAEHPLELVALGTYQHQLLARRLRELERLQFPLQDRPRDLRELRPKRDAQPVRLGERLAQRELPAPGSAADERRRQRDLA